jgi:hypothetical protein
MPVILSVEHHAESLSGEATERGAVSIPAGRMTAWVISLRVNKSQNDDSELIEPVSA